MRMILERGWNLDFLGPLSDFEGHRREVGWVLLQPGVGRYRRQAARRIRITPPLEPGWYPARSSCSVRYNTSSHISVFGFEFCTLEAHLQYFIKLQQRGHSKSATRPALKGIHLPQSNIGGSCLCAIRGRRMRRTTKTYSSSNRSRVSPRASTHRRMGTRA